MSEPWDVVICGAGITGISAAYFLSIHGEQQRILLIDERPPLSLTSDKSSECYRNWWPGGEMVAVMNRSIDLLEGLAGQKRSTALLCPRICSFSLYGSYLLPPTQ